MQAVAAWVGSSFGVFWVISFLDNLLLISFCVLATLTVFHLPVRFRLWKGLSVVVICAALGFLFAMQELRGFAIGRMLSTVQVICPFLLAMLFFPRKDFWKSWIVAFGSNLLDVIKYLVLILVFNYDFQTTDYALDLLLDLLIYTAALIVMAGLFLAYARRKNSALLIARINVPLYLLIVLTLVVFMTTILMLGINHSGSRPVELVVVLANIPLFTGTAIYSALVLLRTKVSEENYKAMVDMQIRHYEQMEAKNEELRIFRHDFPKQLRPLAACLHEKRYAEAEEMVRQFDQSIEYARPRFSTGNTMLDTVLECALQTAEKDGIRIVWTDGSVFPASGIAPKDVYTIFPNALDNAVEACRKLGRPCEVTVSSHVTGSTVYVCIRNPMEGKAVIRGGRVETSKADKTRHGFGTQSMKKAAAKYGSDNLHFSQEDGMFAVNMELQMRHDPIV